MKLTVFNGSPRGPKGNTEVLLNHLIAGWEMGDEHTHERFYLRRLADADRFVTAFGQAECVLIAFPLYTDAMPGIVKAFFESLAPLCGRETNPPLAFLVQSGFPEAVHSRYVERYLENLARRLGCPYLGTIVKGGCEGARMMPAESKLFLSLQQIGATWGQTGRLNEDQLQDLAKPERFPRWMGPLFRVLLKTRFGHQYWDSQLQENGAYERRFARPYE
jgi:NAD(P)H-dependent FMN reductase